MQCLEKISRLVLARSRVFYFRLEHGNDGFSFRKIFRGLWPRSRLGLQRKRLGLISVSSRSRTAKYRSHRWIES